MALVHLGVGTEIANVDTERSPEAAVFRRVYETALKQVLRDFAFPFSTKIAALGLITSLADDDTHPTLEWLYQYQVPSDSLMVRKLQSGIRTDTHESRIPYREAYGTSGTVIYTDQLNAIAEYTVYVSDPTRYPPDFDMAFSFLLAGLAAPGITGGDPFKKGERAMELYMRMNQQSRSNALNEEQPDQEPEAPSIRARE